MNILPFTVMACVLLAVDVELEPVLQQMNQKHCLGRAGCLEGLAFN
jgi:hypothetical protein